MKVIKRNGEEQDFFLDKIKNAVSKANKAVDSQYQMTDEQKDKVISTVQKRLEKFDSVKVEDIQDMVEAALVKHNKYEIAKAYIIFRDNKKKNKKFNDIEESFLAILNGSSAEARGDNANKHIDMNSSARDYGAGTVCKSLANKCLPKDIIEAHKKGLIHWHDSDYYGMNMMNCDLVNVFDMICNGFMMGDTWIDPPKRFSTGCNLAAQIALIVSGSQYGGQTMSWSHLLQLIPSTKQDCKVELLNIMSVLPKWLAKIVSHWYGKMIDIMVRRDIHVGIKTYQYQILCHHSSNGQTPFISNNLCLREAETEEDQKWLAFIIEEILKRRIKGVKDKSGKYISPLFPKLLYWECEGLNVEKTDPYYYLTKLAAKCMAERMQPDINSEKKSREIKSGQIIPSMGCLSGDTFIKVKCDKDILMTTFECLWNNLAQIENVSTQFGIKDNPNLELSPTNLSIWDNKLEQFVNVSKLIRNVSNKWYNIEFTKEVIIQADEEFELDLWNTLSTKYKVVDNKIFPKEEIRIKGKGIVEYLENTINGIIIKCREVIKITATDDHVWTLTNNKDVHSNELKIGDSIFGDETAVVPYKITKLDFFEKEDYSYDVTTESAHFMANKMYSHNCRAWLPGIWEDVTYPRTKAFHWQVIDESNIQYPGAYGKNYNYMRTDNTYYSAIKTSIVNDDLSKIVINFNGNSGWVISHDADKIVVRQPKIYGRWNNGVVTINLPYVALQARANHLDVFNEEGKLVENNLKNRTKAFYEILDERLELCRKALKLRNEECKKIRAKNSPILWMWGGLIRNHDNPELTIGEIMEAHPNYYTISLGYVGLFETCEAIIGESNTTEKGQKFSKEVLTYINDTLAKWKKEDNIPYAFYGTPEESLTYKFALALQRDFGFIDKITDKDYIVNSYHVDPREEIDAFMKLKIEGEYLALSTGGAVSYIETADLTNNPEALEEVIRYMYDHIAYAEVNRKIGICYKCGYQGDIPLSKSEDNVFTFTCPNCGNTDDKFMNITARICGYIGKINAGESNRGRLDDIFHRVIHLQ